jgi:ssDNA-binding Zn-finger/Zn-ribbon topoisomerase 1
MLLREGKFGEFLGCTNYPECKETRKSNWSNLNQKFHINNGRVYLIKNPIQWKNLSRFPSQVSDVAAQSCISHILHLHIHYTYNAMLA